MHRLAGDLALLSQLARLRHCKGFAAGQGYAKSQDGLELHMATNYLGPFLLTMLLLPSLQRSGSKVSHTTMEQTNLQLASMPAEHLHAVVSN